MFRFNKKEQETIPNKPKLLICECGNDMFRNVVKVRLTSPPSTDWVDWYFECNKCGEIYNQEQLSRLTKMAKEMDEQNAEAELIMKNICRKCYWCRENTKEYNICYSPEQRVKTGILLVRFDYSCEEFIKG